MRNGVVSCISSTKEISIGLRRERHARNTALIAGFVLTASFSIAVAAAALWRHRRAHSQAMSEEIRAILATYMPIDEPSTADDQHEKVFTSCPSAGWGSMARRAFPFMARGGARAAQVSIEISSRGVDGTLGDL